MFNLNDNRTIAKILNLTGQTWRRCRRKKYNVYACRMPAGYVFANRLEQPDSYGMLPFVMGRHIVPLEECKKNPKLMDVLEKNGYYVTDGSRITLSGMCGELWDVTEEKLKKSYMLPSGKPITRIPEGWFTVTRKPDTTEQAVGIQIPINIAGTYRTKSGVVLRVNHPLSTGHHTGDILVAPIVNCGIDLKDCSPTNNAVFAATYDLNFGGWARSGLVKAVERRAFTLDECARLYSCDSDVSADGTGKDYGCELSLEKVCRRVDTKTVWEPKLTKSKMPAKIEFDLDD